MKRRVMLFSAVFAAIACLTPAAQTVARVTVRIELPSGELRDISTREGNDAVQISLQDGDSFAEFYLRLAASGNDVVLVSVREGRSGQVLDEFELRTDAGFVRSRTSPSFGLALIAVER